MKLKDIANALIAEGNYHNVMVHGNSLCIEEEWEDNGCKNDDDCCDYAYSIAKELIERFPELEVIECMSHRHKYAIAELALKTEL